MAHGQNLELIRAVGTGEPWFNMNSGKLQASLDRVEAIVNYTDIYNLYKSKDKVRLLNLHMKTRFWNCTRFPSSYCYTFCSRFLLWHPRSPHILESVEHADLRWKFVPHSVLTEFTNLPFVVVLDFSESLMVFAPWWGTLWLICYEILQRLSLCCIVLQQEQQQRPETDVISYSSPSDPLKWSDFSRNGLVNVSSHSGLSVWIDG